MATPNNTLRSNSSSSSNSNSRSDEGSSRMSREELGGVEDSLPQHHCRICHTDTEEPLIVPCDCRGSMGYAHESCLVTWLLRADNIKCEVCNTSYLVTPVYKTSGASVFRERLLERIAAAQSENSTLRLAFFASLYLLIFNIRAKVTTMLRYLFWGFAWVILMPCAQYTVLWKARNLLLPREFGGIPQSNFLVETLRLMPSIWTVQGLAVWSIGFTITTGALAIALIGTVWVSWLTENIHLLGELFDVLPPNLEVEEPVVDGAVPQPVRRRADGAVRLGFNVEGQQQQEDNNNAQGAATPQLYRRSPEEEEQRRAVSTNDLIPLHEAGHVLGLIRQRVNERQREDGGAGNNNNGDAAGDEGNNNPNNNNPNNREPEVTDLLGFTGDPGVGMVAYSGLLLFSWLLWATFFELPSIVGYMFSLCSPFLWYVADWIGNAMLDLSLHSVQNAGPFFAPISHILQEEFLVITVVASILFGLTTTGLKAGIYQPSPDPSSSSSCWGGIQQWNTYQTLEPFFARWYSWVEAMFVEIEEWLRGAQHNEHEMGKKGGITQAWLELQQQQQQQRTPAAGARGAITADSGYGAQSSVAAPAFSSSRPLGSLVQWLQASVDRYEITIKNWVLGVIVSYTMLCLFIHLLRPKTARSTTFAVKRYLVLMKQTARILLAHLFELLVVVPLLGFMLFYLISGHVTQGLPTSWMEWPQQYSTLVENATLFHNSTNTFALNATTSITTALPAIVWTWKNLGPQHRPATGWDLLPINVVRDTHYANPYHLRVVNHRRKGALLDGIDDLAVGAPMEMNETAIVWPTLVTASALRELLHAVYSSTDEFLDSTGLGARRKSVAQSGGLKIPIAIPPAKGNPLPLSEGHATKEGEGLLLNETKLMKDSVSSGESTTSPTTTSGTSPSPEPEVSLQHQAPTPASHQDERQEGEEEEQQGKQRPTNMKKNSDANDRSAEEEEEEGVGVGGELDDEEIVPPMAAREHCFDIFRLPLTDPYGQPLSEATLKGRARLLDALNTFDPDDFLSYWRFSFCVLFAAIVVHVPLYSSTTICFECFSVGSIILFSTTMTVRAISRRMHPSLSELFGFKHPRTIEENGMMFTLLTTTTMGYFRNAWRNLVAVWLMIMLIGRSALGVLRAINPFMFPYLYSIEVAFLILKVTATCTQPPINTVLGFIETFHNDGFNFFAELFDLKRFFTTGKAPSAAEDFSFPLRLCLFGVVYWIILVLIVMGLIVVPSFVGNTLASVLLGSPATAVARGISPTTGTAATAAAVAASTTGTAGANANVGGVQQQHQLDINKVNMVFFFGIDTVMLLSAVIYLAGTGGRAFFVWLFEEVIIRHILFGFRIEALRMRWRKAKFAAYYGVVIKLDSSSQRADGTFWTPYRLGPMFVATARSLDRQGALPLVLTKQDPSHSYTYERNGPSGSCALEAVYCSLLSESNLAKLPLKSVATITKERAAVEYFLKAIVQLQSPPSITVPEATAASPKSSSSSEGSSDKDFDHPPPPVQAQVNREEEKKKKKPAAQQFAAAEEEDVQEEEEQQQDRDTKRGDSAHIRKGKGRRREGHGGASDDDGVSDSDDDNSGGLEWAWDIVDHSRGGGPNELYLRAKYVNLLLELAEARCGRQVWTRAVLFLLLGLPSFLVLVAMGFLSAWMLIPPFSARHLLQCSAYERTSSLFWEHPIDATVARIVGLGIGVFCMWACIRHQILWDIIRAVDKYVVSAHLFAFDPVLYARNFIVPGYHLFAPYCFFPAVLDRWVWPLLADYSLLCRVLHHYGGCHFLFVYGWLIFVRPTESIRLRKEKLFARPRPQQKPLSILTAQPPMITVETVSRALGQEQNPTTRSADTRGNEAEGNEPPQRSLKLVLTALLWNLYCDPTAFDPTEDGTNKSSAVIVVRSEGSKEAQQTGTGAAAAGPREGQQKEDDQRRGAVGLPHPEDLLAATQKVLGDIETACPLPPAAGQPPPPERKKDRGEDENGGSDGGAGREDSEESHEHRGDGSSERSTGNTWWRTLSNAIWLEVSDLGHQAAAAACKEWEDSVVCWIHVHSQGAVPPPPPPDDNDEGRLQRRTSSPSRGTEASSALSTPNNDSSDDEREKREEAPVEVRM